MDFSYRKGQELFRDMNLSLLPGGIYGLLGKNGAGKTTLLKLICGLSFPIKGVIKIGEFTPSDREVSFLTDIFFLGEEIYIAERTPREMEIYLAPFYPSFDNELFKKLLLQLDVDYIDRLNQVSYGQKKKAMIAFGIACNTKYLFMDEPTNGLDIPSKALFRSIMASTYDEKRITVISTHQVRDLQSMIDSVIILNNRQIQFNITLDKVSEKLTFGHGSTIPEGVELLYSANGEMGKSYILKNDNHLPGMVDLETLFNGFISEPHAFNQILND